MPRAPKWIADFMENTFTGKIRTVTVTATDYLTPELKKIRLSGDFAHTRFEEGQAVIFRIDETNFRNYTPSFFDSQAGICEIIVHLHGNGPGSIFLDRLQPGDTIVMGLPRGFKQLRPASDHHFFYGDETTLGVFHSFSKTIRDRGQHYTGIIELAGTAVIPEELDLRVHVVEKKPEQACNVLRYLYDSDASLWKEWKTATFYLMGNARAIQQFRKALRERGISGKQLVTHPYWAEGKIGL
jgi:NADPH-dependent ferric siderophore reductase